MLNGQLALNEIISLTAMVNALTGQFADS